MNTQRPELGATLDHLCVQSGDPDRLAQFLEVAYAMTKDPIAGGWHCEGPCRQLLVTQGRPNHVDYLAYAFDTDEALASHRRTLEAKGFLLAPNPSPLFPDDGFCTTDPNGNVVAFGVRRRADPALPEPLPARLQHLAFRTPDIEDMVRFYSALGFIVSDRVEDDAGTLRACFLRTDHEHHALALFGSPESRLDHISCETRDIAAIVAWADRVSSNGIPIHWGVGRHGPGNDIFFMVKDPDDNLIELSADLEVCDPQRPAGRWRHEPRTLNLWGTAIMRS
jgi:catechol 2,3-dioxygenase